MPFTIFYDKRCRSLLTCSESNAPTEKINGRQRTLKMRRVLTSSRSSVEFEEGGVVDHSTSKIGKEQL